MQSRPIFRATVAVASLSFAAIVSAQEATQPMWPDSTRTRAEVMAELAQAKQDGSIKVRSVTYSQPPASTASRAQVMAELAQARTDGSINVSSVTYEQPAVSTLSRAEVRAELMTAHANTGMFHRKTY
jgi:hypothetical protein